MIFGGLKSKSVCREKIFQKDIKASYEIEMCFGLWQEIC